MFAAALIVFRETLEAALLIGIIAAATRSLVGARRCLAGGVVLGAIGALALALTASQISAWADGVGQDLLNIAILTLALAMLLWHCIWVAGHGREMAAQARRLGEAVEGGRRAPYVLAVAAGLAVLREGAETVLFVSGTVTAADTAQPIALLLACAAGLAAGVIVGALTAFGLTRMAARHLFSVTHWLIAFVAASIASQLARALAQAGWLEVWSQPLWDSSWLLAQDSIVGTWLHALLGYDARPSGAQLAGYLAVLALIVIGTRMVGPRAASNPSARNPAAEAGLRSS